MAAIRFDIIIEQGAGFEQEIQYLDFDTLQSLLNADHTAIFQVRNAYGSTSVLIEGTATINAQAGTITLSIPATETVALNAPSCAVYDVVLLGPAEGQVERLMEGKAIITPGVSTQPEGE